MTNGPTVNSNKSAEPLRLPFNPAALPAIERELNVTAREAAYRVASEPVYELTVPCARLPGAHLLIVLWPSLQRVDVRLVPNAGGAPLMALTAKRVRAVEIYAGVEVMFRRDGGNVLFVTRDGVSAIAD